MIRSDGWYWIRFYKKSRWAPAEWGNGHWAAYESPDDRQWFDKDIYEIGPQIFPPYTNPENINEYLTFQSE